MSEALTVNRGERKQNIKIRMASQEPNGGESDKSKLKRLSLDRTGVLVVSPWTEAVRVCEWR